MSHTPPRRLHAAAPAMSPLETSPDALAMQQLRHQTKNALQRIIAQISKSKLRSTRAGLALTEELERRIRLSARVSDALFGLTANPGPLDKRLSSLCDGMVGLLAGEEQDIHTDVSVSGTCDPAVATAIVQVAHEMLGNAIKHGLHGRHDGRIGVRVRTDGCRGISLTVTDDGAGPVEATGTGSGLSIMRAIAERHGGTVTLLRRDGLTAARMLLPCRA